jgi:hypothetical protein
VLGQRQLAARGDRPPDRLAGPNRWGRRCLSLGLVLGDEVLTGAAEVSIDDFAAATYTRSAGVRHMLAALDLATGRLFYRIRPRKR